MNGRSNKLSSGEGIKIPVTQMLHEEKITILLK
jgi:hypothetical protein